MGGERNIRPGINRPSKIGFLIFRLVASSASLSADYICGTTDWFTIRPCQVQVYIKKVGYFHTSIEATSPEDVVGTYTFVCK